MLEKTNRMVLYGSLYSVPTNKRYALALDYDQTAHRLRNLHFFPLKNNELEEKSNARQNRLLTNLPLVERGMQFTVDRVRWRYDAEDARQLQLELWVLPHSLVKAPIDQEAAFFVLGVVCWYATDSHLLGTPLAQLPYLQYTFELEYNKSKPTFLFLLD